MTPQQAAFSSSMSAVRIGVEWGFMLVCRDWAFVDYVKNLKIWKQPIAKLYHVAAILTNVKTCVMAQEHDTYGNLIANKFGVSPRCTITCMGRICVHASECFFPSSPRVCHALRACGLRRCDGCV